MAFVAYIALGGIAYGVALVQSRGQRREIKDARMTRYLLIWTAGLIAMFGVAYLNGIDLNSN